MNDIIISKASFFASFLLIFFIFISIISVTLTSCWLLADYVGNNMKVICRKMDMYNTDLRKILTMILTQTFDFINDSDWIRKVFKRIIEISAKLIGLNPNCESSRQQTSFTWTSIHRSLHTNLDFDQNCRYFFFHIQLKILLICWHHFIN